MIDLFGLSIDPTMSILILLAYLALCLERAINT